MTGAVIIALALGTAWALHRLFALPPPALLTFLALAGAVYVAAPTALFAAFVWAFAVIVLAKAGNRLLAGGGGMSEWGPGNFLASAGPPVLAAVASGLLPGAEGWQMGALAGLATVVADSAGTEIGVALRGRTVLITSLRPVPPGTDGGVSPAGTAAALAASLLFAAAGPLLGPGDPILPALTVAGLGFAGSVADSLLGATLQRRGRLGNEAVNGVTVAAAVAAGVVLGG